MNARDYVLQRLRADEAEFIALGDTMMGQWGQLSVALNVVWVELMWTLPGCSWFVQRRAQREGWGWRNG